MTEEEYNLLSSTLRIGYEGCPEEIERSLRLAIVGLAVVLESDNSEFDPNKFILACGVDLTL